MIQERLIGQRKQEHEDHIINETFHFVYVQILAVHYSDRSVGGCSCVGGSLAKTGSQRSTRVSVLIYCVSLYSLK